MPPLRVLLLTLLGGCAGGGTDEPEDTEAGYIGFRLEPGTVVLQPGECSIAALVWSGGTALGGDEVEWQVPSSLAITANQPGSFRFCAGDQLGEGDILVRLAGRGEFLFAGEGFVRGPGQPDFDLVEPDWTRGTSPRPTRIFWSADGQRLYTPSEDDGTLAEWDATTLARTDTFIIRSPEATPLDDDRVAVHFGLDGGRKVGVYSLSQRAYTTWYNAETYQPYIAPGGDLVMAASNGRVAALSHDAGNGNCGNGVVDLAANTHTLLSTHTGQGLVPETGAPQQPWPVVSGVGPRNERFMQISESGRYVMYGADSCWSSGTTVVDLQTREHFNSCVPDRPTVSAHRPVFSRDASTLASNTLGGFVVANMADCSRRGTLDYPGLGNVGFDLSADGTEVAFATTWLEDASLARNDIAVLRVPIDADSLAAETPGTLTLVPARYLFAPDDYDFNHRIAYSPDGDQLALAYTDGQVAVVDLESSEVRQASRFLWHTARPTPDPDRVLVRLDDPVAYPTALVDVRTDTILREHPAVQRLEAIYDDGYVLFDQGALTSALVDYDTGATTPITGDLPLSLDEADVTVSADGGTTCSVTQATTVADSDLCLDGQCRPVGSLTDNQIHEAYACVALDNGSALFLGHGSVWSWQGTAAAAVRWTSAFGAFDEASRFYRMDDADILLRTRTHLFYWNR